eukprot:90116-Prymnesium_polylepis.1
MKSPLLCARGGRAMFAACQGRVRACGHMRRQDSGSSRAGVDKLRHGRTSKRELRRLGLVP